MKKAADQREEAKTDIEAEYSSYKSLADRIFELSDAESLSNDEKSGNENSCGPAEQCHA